MRRRSIAFSLLVKVPLSTGTRTAAPGERK